MTRYAEFFLAKNDGEKNTHTHTHRNERELVRLYLIFEPIEGILFSLLGRNEIMPLLSSQWSNFYFLTSVYAFDNT